MTFSLPFLSSLLKLPVDHFFVGVLPGKYSLVWRMKLDGVYLNGDHSRNAIEFRARPEKSCGKELCSKWTDYNELRRAERRHGNRCEWYLQNMGDFEVTASGVGGYHGIMWN